ncbi:MAG: UDP-N-acetylglucosamine 2-epimerase (non-hydrolyzing) [Defluviitaleaceae bacterium]|nr:UDP-N-acetylglucosamine 2-epimerase (non-hydrolyzing) [Defluviitaleaceae bacterium]
MSKADKIKILCVFGTRPEAVKMAPLVKALQASDVVDCVVCVSAQHREMLDMVLDIFDIIPNYDLDIMTKNQDLAQITTKTLNGLMDVIGDVMPDLMLVHGDTTTTMAASLAAYYAKVRLGHIEAGLRTHNKFAPYPEELNRRIVGVCADIHFAPTITARDNLLAENVRAGSIFVTGNTEIDAVAFVTKDDHKFKNDMLKNFDFAGKRVITMTAHRRENYGKPFENIFNAVLRIADDFDDVEVVYPVHPSPVVQGSAQKMLSNHPKVHLIDPLDVDDLQNLMARSHLVLTDSGALQEGAPYHNKPVVVLREVTERPEGLAAGCLVLGGVDEQTIYIATARLLNNDVMYSDMCNAKNPFGDGLASQRILESILYYFGRTSQKPNEFNT